ncbi:MAG TPA: hypothetical protein PLA01_00360 [Acetivibrio sp.]|nr:hypothetical protein [Acetivibrio sp.]
MEHLKKRLLEESLRFIELCQAYYLKGRIDGSTYNSLTGIKLHFIKDVLKRERIETCCEKKLLQKVDSLFMMDKKISNSDKIVVCLKDCCV